MIKPPKDEGIGPFKFKSANVRYSTLIKPLRSGIVPVMDDPWMDKVLRPTMSDSSDGKGPDNPTLPPSKSDVAFWSKPNSVGRAPENLFDLRSMLSSIVSNPSSEGNGPENILLLKRMSLSRASREIEAPSLPLKELPDKSRERVEFRDQKESGRAPVNWQREMFKLDSCFSSPISENRLPLKALFPKSRLSILLSRPSCVGRGPLKRLVLAEITLRCCSAPISDKSVPVSQFLDTENFFKFVMAAIWGTKGPTRLLP